MGNKNRKGRFILTSFRISKGIEKDLPTAKTDGRMYFCTDTGNIYIDYKDGNTVSRKLINKNSLDKKLNLTGGTISGKLTFSGTSADTANLAFSREGYNYITFPANGNLAFGTEVTGSGIVVGISSSSMYPYSNNTKTLGASDKKWSNVYATNFTGSGASLTSLNASNISSGTLSSDRLSTIPIAKGGTGATTAAGALTNLGITATAAELNKMDGVTASTTELNYVDGVTSNIQTQLDGKLAKTAGYAGSSSAGGSATSAVKLDSSAGSATQPVYFSGGKPVATTYTLGKSVPSDAKFTDTTYTLSSFGITATAAELNKLDGVTASTTEINKLKGLTATTTELNYVDGVTSAIQTQLNSKQASITGAATTITGSNLTASRALISNSSGKVAVSAVTSTELGYLDGVTSAIQTQLDGKVNKNDNKRAYNNLVSYYSGGTTPTYYRITFPDSIATTWTMINMEIFVREAYGVETGGKILINAHHANTTTAWTINASTLGNLTSEIKVYSSDGKYFYIKGCGAYSTISIDKILVGDSATSIDISSIKIDIVSTLPTTYQTATMYYEIHSGNIGSQSVNYANSAGSASSATALISKSIGSATNPVYFDANGKPVKTTYTLGKSVPSDAKFTDTTYSAAGSALGLVKSGGDVTISSGVITVKDDSHNHVISNIDGLQTALDDKQNKYGNRHIITVKGEANKYYPVLITNLGQESYAWSHLHISRGYSWVAPDTWNTATHRGGLTLSLRWSGDTGWGGNDHDIEVEEFAENYTTMVGGLTLSVSGLVVWLRGGTAQYAFQTDYGNSINITVNLGTYTAADGKTYAVKTTPDTAGVKAFWYNRHGTYVGNASSATKATQDGSGNTITSTYATKTELTNGLAGKANTSHTHTKSQITDFPSSLPASDVYSWAKASSKPSYSWSEITSKPSTFTPASHTHISLKGNTDNRSVATTPNDYNAEFKVAGLKQNNIIGSPSSDTYSGVVGFRQWSDNSGGNAHELAFNDSGLFMRSGASTAWGSWEKFITSANIGSQSVNHAKTASTATALTSKSIGSATNPVYFDANGKPVKTTYTLGKSVPSDAKFTDTTYTFNGAVSTIKDSNLTASRALISNSSGKVAVSAVTSTELGYLDGVTSAIQTQLNGKAASSHNQAASTITAGTFAGQVVANSSGQTYSTYCLRNTRLASSDTNPTVNGQICWTYE